MIEQGQSSVDGWCRPYDLTSLPLEHTLEFPGDEHLVLDDEDTAPAMGVAGPNLHNGPYPCCRRVALRQREHHNTGQTLPRVIQFHLALQFVIAGTLDQLEAEPLLRRQLDLGAVPLLPPQPNPAI